MAAVSTRTRHVDPKILARRKLAAMRQQMRRIRIWVGCLAVVLFLALFATIYVQMARGHDPALGSGAPAKTPTATATATKGTPQRVALAKHRAAVAKARRERAVTRARARATAKAATSGSGTTSSVTTQQS
jgi:hypothetical protein